MSTQSFVERLLREAKEARAAADEGSAILEEVVASMVERDPPKPIDPNSISVRQDHAPYLEVVPKEP